MGVTVVTGDLFTSQAEVLVNAVNCKGVSGAGIALQFKQKYPQYQKEYQKLCYSSQLELGKPILQQVNGKTTKYILSFPTKNHFTETSSLISVTEGLINSKPLLNKLPSDYVIAVPKLGAGCGGLKSKNSISLIESYWGDLEQDVLLYK